MRVSVLAFVMLVGCADTGDEGMYIVNNTAAPAGITCMLTSDPAQPFIAQGIIWAGGGVPYILTPLIKSRITSPIGDEDEHTIHLEGANIVLSAADSTGTLNQAASYTSLFAASLGPGATANVSFDLIPAATLASVFTSGKDTQFSASVTVFGTQGNSRMEGQTFNYPVTACVETNGTCVVDIPAPGACPLTTTGTIALGNPCNVFQDGAVTCCVSGTQTLCGTAAM